jgi:hypothetical protein
VTGFATGDVTVVGSVTGESSDAENAGKNSGGMKDSEAKESASAELAFAGTAALSETVLAF